MLNKHYASVLTLAILFTLGITPESVATSHRAKLYSSFGDKLTTLEEKNIFVGLNSLATDYEPIDINEENAIRTIIAQNTSNSETSTEQNKPAILWWLVPVIILVPFLGWLLLKPGSSSKTQQTDENP